MNSDQNDGLRAVLSANVSHYYYTALALQQAGYLRRYICAITARGRNGRLARVLPDYWRKKLQGRDISAIKPELVRSIWLAEALQRGLPALRLTSRDRADWLNNYLFDALAQRWLEPCDVFHFTSSVGLYCAGRAKAMGSLVVCDSRTEYPDYQFAILAEEYERLGLPFNPPGLLYDKKVKAEYAIADVVIVPSSYAKRTFVAAGFNEEAVFVLPYGVDKQQFFALNGGEEADPECREAGWHNSSFRILYAGQIIPRKGIAYLISAFEKLRVKAAELVLVGRVDAALAPLMTAAVQRDSRIRVAGELPKTELYKLYNSGSVLVLPSLADSWGLVVPEAMACGLPVIASANAGSSEAIQDGMNGFIVPARDSDALADRLAYLYEHPSQRRSMGQAARRSMADFTWERYGQRLLAIYHTIIARNTASGPNQRLKRQAALAQ